jgi:hypothetical protein
MWFDKYVAEVYFVEKEFVDSTYGFMGHPDIGVRLIDGRNVIVDYKTPASEKKTWAPQIAAYLHLANKAYEGSLCFDAAMALQPRKDGGMAKATVYQYSNNDFAIFLNALNLFRYFRGDSK